MRVERGTEFEPTDVGCYRIKRGKLKIATPAHEPDASNTQCITELKIW